MSMPRPASSSASFFVAIGSEQPMSISTPPFAKPRARPSQPKATSRTSAADGSTVMIASQACAIILGEPVIIPPTSMLMRRATSAMS